MAQRAGSTSLMKWRVPPNAIEIVGTGPAEAIEDDGLRLGDDVQLRVLQCDVIYSGSMGCGFYLADAQAD